MTRRALGAARITQMVLWTCFSAVAYKVYIELAALSLIGRIAAAKANPTLATSALLSDAQSLAESEQRAIWIYTAAVLVGGVFFMFWTYRANRAARELGATDMVFGPGATVGWWFVPFVSLFKPCQAVQELWKASDPNPPSPHWSVAPNPPLVGWWWLLTLAELVGRRILSASFSTSPSDLDSAQSMLHTYLAFHVVDIAALLLTIAVVARITARLRERAQRVGVPEARAI